MARRMPVEFFTETSRIVGDISTQHIHVRDELNDGRTSILLFHRLEMSDLHAQAAQVTSAGAWLEKSAVLLAVPYRIKGTTSMLTQRTIQARLGKDEHRILIDVPPFRVQGNFLLAGKPRVEDILRRDRVPFALVTQAEVTYLPDPAVSFTVEELVFNCEQLKMLCTSFETQ